MKSGAQTQTQGIGTILKYRGRALTRCDAAFIRELIARNPQASRRRISRLLCETWNWRQPNGTLCDMVCRGLLLALHRAGHVTLPPPRRVGPNYLALGSKSRPASIAVDTSSIIGALGDVQPLAFHPVRRTKLEALFDGLIAQYHYLGYTRPVGEHLKYLVLSRDRPVACLAFSSAPRHLGPRDRFIGWTPELRRRNLRFVAYNPRFLIPPWVRVRHLASHVLSRITRVLPCEWQRFYGHPVYFVETFVDPTRYRGTCYLAANWVYLGRTTGRGKDDRTHRGPNRPLKDVWGYPLVKRFRELLWGAPEPQ